MDMAFANKNSSYAKNNEQLCLSYSSAVIKVVNAYWSWDFPIVFTGK
jgi:hypothetical protein